MMWTKLYLWSLCVLSINNSRFAGFLPLIYPPELEVKETTGTASSTSFLDFYLKFDDSGQLSTKIYDKRELLIDKTSSIYLYVKLKALAS
jgi:hypothetical protein